MIVKYIKEVKLSLTEEEFKNLMDVLDIASKLKERAGFGTQVFNEVQIKLMDELLTKGS